MTRVLTLPVGSLKDASVQATRVGRDDGKAVQMMLMEPRREVGLRKAEAKHSPLLTQGVAGDALMRTSEKKYVLLTQGLAGGVLTKQSRV